MAKIQPLRIRLTKTHTITEIESLMSEIQSNPDSKIGANGINIYNRSAMKKLDEMTWAIYSLSKNN